MKYGLFVGINQYTNGISPLKCARNDALALSKLFALNGYEVDALLDQEADATNIRKKLRAIGKQLKKDDFFFFYFSGHGCEVSKNHYLIGQAAYPDGIEEGEETVALNRVRELTDVPGVRRLFVLDCCRNDLHNGRGLEVCPESRDIALSKISNFQYEAAEIIHPLIVTSCSTGERAYEDLENGRGYFTQVLEKSLLDKTISSFSAFRKALAEGMENIQKIMKRKQTLCWHGNVDSWDDFDLLDSWTKTSFLDERNESSCKESVLLSPEDRIKYNDLILVLDEACRKVEELSAPESIKVKLPTYSETVRILSDEERNSENLQKLQELQVEIENVKKNLNFYQSVLKIVREVEKDKAFLKEHAIALDPEFYNLEKRAIFAQEKEDFEVANDLWKKVKTLIIKPRMLLTSQLKQIEDLRTEIKKTENQLSCSSESIHTNFGYNELLQKAERLKDYTEMASVLSAILKHNREKIRLQSVVLDSISEIKSKIAEIESFFKKEKMSLPAEAAGLRESAQKYFDQKKYSESEKQWKSLFQLLTNQKNDYQSYLSVKNEAEFLENKFTEKKISVSAKIREIFEKAEKAELNSNFSEAKLFWKEVVSLLQDDDSAVCEIKKVREQITQKRKMLEAADEKVPEAYRVYLQNADKANSQNEYRTELQCLIDARALLNNLENQIESKQQAEINKLKNEFERKNRHLSLDDKLLKAYGLDQVSDLAVWRGRLQVVEAERCMYKTYIFFYFFLLILSAILIFGVRDTVLAGLLAFLFPIVILTISGFCLARWVLNWFAGFIQWIMIGLFHLAYNDGWNLNAIFMFIGLAIVYLFAPIIVSRNGISYIIFKLIWHRKTGKRINFDTYDYENRM